MNLVREVLEETGLHVTEATLIALYTGRNYCITNRFGNEFQGFEFLLRVDNWYGKIEEEAKETLGIGFFPIDAPPSIEEGYWEIHHREVMEDFKRFNETLILK